jgi:ribonuclease R
MREHLGEEYSGVVTSATSFGIFVTLDAMYVAGLVNITELGAEYFRFDEARQELRGERTGIRYAIGTRVQIQVSRGDLDGRKIEFRLVTEEGVGRVTRERSAPFVEGDPARSASRSEGRATDRRKDAPRERTASPKPSIKASVKQALDKKKSTKARKSRR